MYTLNVTNFIGWSSFPVLGQPEAVHGCPLFLDEPINFAQQDSGLMRWEDGNGKTSISEECWDDDDDSSAGNTKTTSSLVLKKRFLYRFSIKTSVPAMRIHVWLVPWRIAKWDMPPRMIQNGCLMGTMAIHLYFCCSGSQISKRAGLKEGNGDLTSTWQPRHRITKLAG